MSNIQVESGIEKILNRIEARLDRADQKSDELSKVINEINIKLTKVETKLDEGVNPKIDILGEQIKEIKNSQQAQIWTLIGVLITAVGGFLVAVGRFVLSGNP